MPTGIALLRAVNVGGRSVPMAELRDCAAGLGLSNVRSLLQTGNLIFDGSDLAGAALEARLEAAIADVIIRTPAQWRAAISANPFGEAAVHDPGHLVLMALKSSPNPEDVAAVQAAIVGRETAHVVGGNLYIVYPDGIGTSKLTISVIERKLRVRGTARNWNTVLKIAAALSSPA